MCWVPVNVVVVSCGVLGACKCGCGELWCAGCLYMWLWQCAPTCSMNCLVANTQMYQMVSGMVRQQKAVLTVSTVIVTCNIEDGPVVRRPSSVGRHGIKSQPSQSKKTCYSSLSITSIGKGLTDWLTVNEWTCIFNTTRVTWKSHHSIIMCITSKSKDDIFFSTNMQTFIVMLIFIFFCNAFGYYLEGFHF